MASTLDSLTVSDGVALASGLKGSRRPFCFTAGVTAGAAASALQICPIPVGWVFWPRFVNIMTDKAAGTFNYVTFVDGSAGSNRLVQRQATVDIIPPPAQYSGVFFKDSVYLPAASQTVNTTYLLTFDGELRGE